MPFSIIRNQTWKTWSWRLGLIVGLAILLFACRAGQHQAVTAMPEPLGDEVLSPELATQFESEYLKFDSLLALEAEPRNGIVFSGSSSIRKWDSLQRDMRPLPVVNRGFGGAIIKQVTNTTTRMIVPLRPKLVVFYCGENDIANDKYPAQMPLNDFKTFSRSLQTKLPGTGIIFISMKPSPLRWKYWPKFQESNRLIKNYIEEQPRMWYVDVSRQMIGRNGLPKPELFVSDSLHMSPAGYALWTQILKPVVAQRFDELRQK